jgi:copper transport protein
VLAVAAYSATLVRRGTPPGSPALGRLRRGVLVEVAGAAVALGLAAALVQATPGSAAGDGGGAGAGAGPVGQVSATLDSPLYQLQVDVSPATVGPNGLHLYAYSPIGAPMPVVEWEASAELPAVDAGPVPIALLRLTDNHATGQVTLPRPGIWRLRFTLRVSDVDEATVTWTVRVR